MTDEIEVTETSEIDTLKARADMLGIKYTKNIGVDTLRARIENKLAGAEEAEEKPKAKAKPVKKVEYLTEAEFQQLERQNRRRKAGSLVRVRVTCMNPNKKGWEGEIISAGSASLGTFKKFVQFNVEWHVPHIIYEAMKERKFTTFVNERGPRGQDIKRSRLVPEFNIEVLPPLTAKEREDLRKQQALAKGE